MAIIANALTIEGVFEMLQNYPECSTEWIRCTHWGYRDGIDNIDMRFEVDFSYKEGGEIEELSVTRKDLGDVLGAMRHLAHKHIDNEVSLYGYDPTDICTYDLYVIDTVMQLYFFNDIIYG